MKLTIKDYMLFDGFFFAVFLVGLAGPVTIYLGYKLLMKGISGGFEFTANMKGTTLALASASPGLFVILCGTAITLSAMYLMKMWDRSSQPPKDVEKEIEVEKNVDALCPFCGERLASSRARQCLSCSMAWYDPDNPKKLNPNK